MESIVSSQSFSHCTHTHGGRDTEYTLQPLKKNICKISCLCFFFEKGQSDENPIHFLFKFFSGVPGLEDSSTKYKNTYTYGH
jgi:hypothetical protein